MRKRRRREGYELVFGPGTINAWRSRQFSSEQKQRELEIARAFCRALSDDLDARESHDEPFDIEVFSESENKLVAGVQLVEAYDDSRRRRDEERRRAMEDLRYAEGLSNSIDGWYIAIRTATALVPTYESNRVANQMAVVRELLTQVDWSQDQFSVGGPNISVSGQRRHSVKTGSFWYVCHGGLLPFPKDSLFLNAAQSKVNKYYSRREGPPFWLLVYSLSLSPDARDCQVCRDLLERQNPFSDIFLFDVMGGNLVDLSEDRVVGETPGEVPLGAMFQFQLDPSSVMDPGSLNEESFFEITL
jgi:hypothetical protein